MCKMCCSEYNKRYYQDNGVVLRSKIRDNYERNKESILTRQKRYRDANKAKLAQKDKEYRLRNKDVIREQKRNYERNNRELVASRKRRWAAQNKEHLINYRREYYQKNKVALNAKSRTFRKDNKDIVAEYSRRRIAHKISVTIGVVPTDIDEILYTTQEGICALCGLYMERLGKLHTDHIIPLSKGGVHAVWNLQRTHSGCNESKNNKLPEYGTQLALL